MIFNTQNLPETRLLGKGFYGRVFSSIWNHKAIAIKHAAGLAQSITLFREYMILSYLKDEEASLTLHYICNLVEEIHFSRYAMPMNSYSFCFGLTLYDTSLYNALNKYTFSMGSLQQIAYQMSVALSYLREKSIVHTDLSLSNILLCTQTGNIALADFGLARLDHSAHRPTHLEQTLAYRAPESALSSLYASYPMDAWSLGVILIELYIKRSFFAFNAQECQSEEANLYLLWQHETILEEPYPYSLTSMHPTWYAQKKSPSDHRTLQTWKEISAPTLFFSFTRNLLIYDPTTRMTPDAMQQHPFLYKDALSTCTIPTSISSQTPNDIADPSIVLTTNPMLYTRHTPAQFVKFADNDILHPGELAAHAILRHEHFLLQQLQTSTHILQSVDLFLFALPEHPRRLAMLYEPFSLQSLDAYYHMHHVSQAMTRSFLQQMQETLLYLKDKHLVHGNIHPRSLLVSHDGIVKIMDFSRASLEGCFNPLQDLAQDDVSYEDGCFYQSPERKQHRALSYPSDIYSLGRTFDALCNPKGVFARIAIFFLQKNTPFQEMIAKMTIENPLERLSIEQLIDQPFMKSL